MISDDEEQGMEGRAVRREEDGESEDGGSEQEARVQGHQEEDVRPGAESNQEESDEDEEQDAWSTDDQMLWGAPTTHEGVLWSITRHYFQVPPFDILPSGMRVDTAQN